MSITNSQNKTIGSLGERLAEEFLKSKGHIIVERNYKNALGEIDLITRDGNRICFCEVKTRKSLECGQPFEAVHYFKKKKLSRLALSYLKQKYHHVDIPSRFDVVSVVVSPNAQAQITHFPNAFDLI